MKKRDFVQWLLYDVIGTLIEIGVEVVGVVCYMFLDMVVFVGQLVVTRVKKLGRKKSMKRTVIALLFSFGALGY